MKILYVEDEVALLSLISMEVEAELDCEVIELSSGNKAMAWLKSNDCSQVAAIVSDQKMPDGSGAILFAYVKANHPNIPFILTTGSADAHEETAFSELLSTNPKNSILLKPFHLDALVQKLKLLLELPSEQKSKKYLRVSHSRFRKSQTPPCNIFLKISEEKFLKIVNANEGISQDFIEKYQKKGIDYFYVSEDDFVKFSEHYNNYIKQKLLETPQAAESVDLQLQGFESVQDYIQNIGLDSSIVETMNTVTKSSIEVMKHNPDLFKLVRTMMHEENYLSEHSMMISYVAGALALEMEWVTTSTLQKLATAALLHDAYLADSKLAKISHKPESEWALELKPEQIELIKRHPIIMADLIKKTKGIDPDIDLIVFNHHETADGKGYPRQLDYQKIFPLAAFFIVAEQFVNSIYAKNPSDSDINLIIKGIEQTYTKGNFLKAAEALRKVFGKPFA